MVLSVFILELISTNKKKFTIVKMVLNQIIIKSAHPDLCRGKSCPHLSLDWEARVRTLLGTSWDNTVDSSPRAP